jgi:tRNA A-37 threonylcarbamoyl transferase component Bud32
MPMAPVQVGDTIASRYLIEGLIADVDTGVTLAALDRERKQRVAIEFLHPELAQRGEAAERFRRAALAVAALRNQHVRRVLDVGTLDNGVPYMVMDDVEGMNLASELERRERLPWSEAIGYVLQVCEALVEAHAEGIVHGALTLGRLQLASRADGSRCVQVSGFGLARCLLESAAPAATLLQTRAFDSASDPAPEPRACVDPQVDISALGALLCELSTGRMPARSDATLQLVDALPEQPPAALPSVGVRLPDGLEALLSRAWTKAAADRFASVREFAEALTPFAAAVWGKPPSPSPRAGKAARAGVRLRVAALLALLCLGLAAWLIVASRPHRLIAARQSTLAPQSATVPATARPTQAAAQPTLALPAQRVAVAPALPVQKALPNNAPPVVSGPRPAPPPGPSEAPLRAASPRVFAATKPNPPLRTTASPPVTDFGGRR